MPDDQGHEPRCDAVRNTCSCRARRDVRTGIQMKKLLTHPLTLRAMHCFAMARAYIRYRNPRRRGVGKQHAAFHERAWAEAATELGGTCIGLGSGIYEIARDEARTRVYENVSGIDDPPTLAVLHD